MGLQGPCLRALPAGGEEAHGVVDAEEDAVVGQEGEPRPAVKVHPPPPEAVRGSPLGGLGLHDNAVIVREVVPQLPEDGSPQATVPPGGGDPKIVDQDVACPRGVPQQGVAQEGPIAVEGPHGV